PALKAVIQQRPDLVSAQALLGELLVEEATEFLQWHVLLPDDADRHPDIWLARGLFARHQNDMPVAARCFWETIRLAPSHRRGNYQLGQVLQILKADGAENFISRASQLALLTQRLNTVLISRGQDLECLKSIVTILEGTGRMIEARAWAEFSTSRVTSDWPLEALERTSDLPMTGPLVLESANLSRQYNYSGLPDHRQLISSMHTVQDKGFTASPKVQIQFAAEADCGLDFIYNNGHDPSTRGGRMFEQAGGGTAVLDYDGDGWPDLFLPQGGVWKSGEQAATPLPEFFDRLFHNHNGRQLIDVTREAGIHCLGFGQGSSVGDFNNDGFPDLYIANVGANQLLINNGDGTFSDVTHRSGLQHRVWTSSCMIVDLNADGLADLFDVNYLTDNDVFTRICDGLGCSPKHFQGQPDMVHINQGDGSFTSLSVLEMRTGVTDGLPRDSGLGVIAADIHQRGRPSLFITNDGVPNLFLKNTPSENSHNIQLEDSGFLSGLAFNEDGLAMACMGIAAGDVNGDQRLDFFVTNFRDEPNTLYIQDANGLFSDATSQYGLEFPSMKNIGWGTQFLDADLDGDPDLVLVNSDVDDLREEGGGFGMRPQLFQNTGRQFDELTGAAAGPFFSTDLAGRGLAKLDWNRDGRMDFAVSVILDPAVIVTNRTTGGHFLNVEVRATRTARDAIGTTVEVTAGQNTWSRTLITGDGYMASNQRVLQFGLGNAGAVDHVQVTWPSGAVTTVEHLASDTTIRLVESYATGTLRDQQGLRSLPVNTQPVLEVQALLPVH
ncbi:MAG: CRTAC1 family protein, partial [Planctomycetaceae bacterium]